MDAQSRVIDAAALAAVVHCLVHLRAHEPRMRDTGPEVLDENRFVAARDGMRAQLIDERTSTRRSAWDALMELLDGCRRVGHPARLHRRACPSRSGIAR